MSMLSTDERHYCIIYYTVASQGEDKENCWGEGCRSPTLPTKNENTIIYYQSLKQYEQ